MKPVEYLKPVQGFGTWHIAYIPAAKKWQLSYNVRIKGEQWNPIGHFDVAEAAAVRVGRRNTGFDSWDRLGFSPGVSFDLSTWKTEPSEGAQDDASENSGG